MTPEARTIIHQLQATKVKTNIYLDRTNFEDKMLIDLSNYLQKFIIEYEDKNLSAEEKANREMVKNVSKVWRENIKE